MKKLLSILLLSTITTASVTTVVSCNIGNNSSRDYISSLSNYDWSNDNSGDKSIVKFNNSNNILETPSNSNQILNVNNGIIDTIFDYDKFSTGYKNINFIKKQGVTGAPIVKSYRPNGNTWSDFGINSASRRYQKINSILEWDKNDLDLEYNKAKIDIANRNFVAKKSIDLQQDEVFYNRIQNKTNSDNSIVGTKKPYNAMLTNFSYVNGFTGWGSSYSNLAWISPPHADVTEQLHKNGVPAYGLMYFSGWEDVTREKLKDMFKKDKNGNYKIVDVLIGLCIKLNFDGWFINNEANASAPNGTVIDDKEMYEIINQFNYKAEKLAKETGNLIQIIYYKNTQSIDLSQEFGGDVNLTLRAIDGTTRGFGENSVNNNIFQLDFNRQYPGVEEQFFKLKSDLGESFRNRVYSLYSEERNPMGIGNNDLRKYLYQLKNKYQDGNLERLYSLENPAYSLSDYIGQAANNLFADSFINYLNSKQEDEDNQLQLQWNLLMGQIMSNQMSVYQYNGYNTYISDTDTGYEPSWRDYQNGSWEPENLEKFEEMIRKTKRDNSYSNDVNYLDIISSDPRFKRNDLTSTNKAISDEVKKNNPQYFYNEKTGKYKHSFGIGSMYQEMTTITDSDYDQILLNEIPKQFDSLRTNFSTGSGMKFLLRDMDGKLIENNSEYPWSNNRLADTMPTYQWDFWKEVQTNNTVEDKTVDGTKNRIKISPDGQLSPYYDYHNPYQKGNSLTIGNGYNFDKNGQVINGQWESGKYNWNIMGANLQSNNYSLDFIIQVNDDQNNLKEIAKKTKIIITTSRQNSTPIVLNTEASELKDGWVKITANLDQMSSISSNERIAKIGLQIDNSGGNDNFKFTLGEFEIKKHQLPEILNTAVINSITNQYTVLRKEDYGLNIRFNWDSINSDNVDYYEIFNLYENEWYRVGETSQNYYYIHNLINTKDLWIGIRPIYKNGLIGNFYKTTFKT